MTKADVVDRIASGTGLTRIETEAVIDGFLTTLEQALQAGDHLEIRGFGTFRVQYKPARSARNPRTNRIVLVDEQYVPAFKASREFRKSVDQAIKAGR